MTALTVFWLGIGAAQKGARAKEVKASRHLTSSVCQAETMI
jgi:hypothetical protein